MAVEETLSAGQHLYREFVNEHIVSAPTPDEWMLFFCQLHREFISRILVGDPHNEKLRCYVKSFASNSDERDFVWLLMCPSLIVPPIVTVPLTGELFGPDPDDRWERWLHEKQEATCKFQCRFILADRDLLNRYLDATLWLQCFLAPRKQTGSNMPGHFNDIRQRLHPGSPDFWLQARTYLLLAAFSGYSETVSMSDKDALHEFFEEWTEYMADNGAYLREDKGRHRLRKPWWSLIRLVSWADVTPPELPFPGLTQVADLINVLPSVGRTLGMLPKPDDIVEIARDSGEVLPAQSGERSL